MLIQGTSEPLVIRFDRDLTDAAALIITLWKPPGTLLKKYGLSDVVVDEDTVSCPLTEEESAGFPAVVRIEAKGLDDEGNQIFWDAINVDILYRYDRDIRLTEDTSW